MTDGPTHLIDNTHPLPAARPLGDFATERIGDELILFDGSTMQYHTLNGVAEQIWRSCDGTTTIASIAASTGLPVETVETTIGELGEASLLAASAEKWSVPMTRRRAAKLIAAGAVGLPVVLSITAPHSTSAATPECGEWTKACDESLKCRTLPRCDAPGYTVTCSYEYPDLSGGLRWEDTGSGYGCEPVGGGSIDIVEYVDDSDMQPFLTEEQRGVLDSAQSTIDRADNALNAPEQTEPVVEEVVSLPEADEVETDLPTESSSGGSGVTVETSSSGDLLAGDSDN